MPVLTVPYPHLGFFPFDQNAVTPSNYTQRLYFPSRFQTIVLDVTGKRRRIGKIVVLRAQSGMVIEKQQEFKPSFDEYLKAMETVKTRREKRSASTGTPPSPPPKIDEGTVDLSDTEEQISVQKVVNLKQDEVKKTWIRTKLDSREARSGASARVKDTNIVGKNAQKYVKFQGYVKDAAVDQGRVLQVKKLSGSGAIDQPSVLLNSNQGEIMKIWTRKNSDSKRVKAMDTNGFKNLDSKRVKATDTNGFQETETRQAKFQEKSFNMKWGSEVRSVRNGSYKMDAVVDKERVVHVKKLSGKSDQVVKYDNYDSMEVERAAFKSLEEFQDVCDQPRVSRVDMEERIQSLNGASIDTPEWNFSKMMRSAKIRFADFSMIRLIQILGNYGNWRQVLQVIEWMQSRERFKSNRIRNIYTAALDALGKARRPVEALNVFHTMQQHMPSYPDLVAYRCIAVTLGQAGHMRELFHVIDSMRSPPKKKFPTGVLKKWDPRLEPDMIVYNAVLNACVRQKSLEGAFWVFQQLKQQGQKPNSITYGLVMEVMLECEKYNLVHEFFKKMQKSFIPNSLTYKVLVNTFWREGKVDEAILAVEDMERRGVVGSAGLYYDLARCLCSAGRCEEALVQVANKPLVVTYTGLIQASLDSGKIKSGIYIFNHMHKFCFPNLVTYNVMLKGYLDHHLFEEARELFHKLLEKRGHVTSSADYRHTVLPDIYTFNLMLDACLVNQRWDDLEFFYTRMLQHGYYFNTKRHFQEMFCMNLKQEDYASAFSCLICLPSTESHKYSRNSWLHRFNDDPHLFREETLLQLIDKITILSIRNEEPNTIFLNLLKS
ncbi:Pentatricopeptide repeat-containing protein, partial [Cynara cardunculus var. scolymus]